jgi:integrase
VSKRKKNVKIQCRHFSWILSQRDNGVYYADGRSNSAPVGRHSLGTKNREEALELLAELDQQRAEDLGLAPRTKASTDKVRALPIAEGRALYEKHISRPRVTGGVQKSTQKRYSPVFDKFQQYCNTSKVETWDRVDVDVLNGYAEYLANADYAHKTLVNELTTLKQAVRWLIEAGHLVGVEPIQLRLRKAESVPAYCYRPEEVAAMLEHCRKAEELKWLLEIIIALACTGLRIAELASLRWADFDWDQRLLILTDETGHASNSDAGRRQLKSGRSRRFPIHPDLLKVLEEMPRRDRFVFHGPRGGKLKPDTVRRALIRYAIKPLEKRFPKTEGKQSFADGRLHSFRHYFCSVCANSSVPERMLMDWLGHADSEMIRRYYHAFDREAKQRMNQINFLGDDSGRSASETEANQENTSQDDLDSESAA